jgi:site-specific recombinase XerD
MSEHPPHLAAYLESLRVRSLSPETIRGHTCAVLSFFLAAGVADVREVTREHIRAHAAALCASRKLAVGTVRARLLALKAFFAWLEATNAILINPSLGLALPSEAARLPKRVLSESEVRRILASPDPATPKGRRDRAVLELFYSSGIRLEEMQKLAVHDLDLTGGFIRVNCGKGGRGRIVPIGETACAALRTYLAVRPGWLRASKDPLMTDALWLSSVQPYHPIDKPAIALIVRRAAARAGIKRVVGPHLWRHTCATHLLNGGGNVVYVQKLLGHRRLKTTEIYTRVTIRDLKRTHRNAHPRCEPHGRKRRKS